MPIRSGKTLLGVQTICHLKSLGRMAFGHYGIAPVSKGMPSQHWDPRGPEIELRDRGRVRRCDVDPDWKNLASQPLSPNENPVGEWNKAEVVCSGDSAEFFFNGKKVGEYRNLTPSSGRIQLQSEGFGIEYRNIVMYPTKRR